MNSTILKRSVLSAGSAIALIALLAACSRGADTSGGSSSGSTASFSRMAIVTPATEADHGWNQVGLKDAQAAADKLGLKLDAYPNVGYDNPETNIEQAAIRAAKAPMPTSRAARLASAANSLFVTKRAPP